jgi:hypothetical protein
MRELPVHWEPPPRKPSVSFKTFLLLTLGAAVLVFCLVLLVVR